jgi:hypothetical protein
MFAPEIIGDFVQHTNNYAKWKIEQKGSEDPVWYDELIFNERMMQSALY